MRIQTNHQPRLLLDWDQLTAKEQAGLSEKGRDFVRYRGVVYDLGEFEYIPVGHPFHSNGWWEGFNAETASSGVIMKYLRYGSDVNMDYVIMAVYVK